MKKLIIMTGQTATGKTQYALNIAKQIDGELVNFDARQIYKRLDIITGKDINSEGTFEIAEQQEYTIGFYLVQNIPIWLYDIVEPTQHFSAYDYQQCCFRTLKMIWEKNKVPILVGGSYFYLQYLLYNTTKDKIEPDWNLRKELETKSLSDLQSTLKQLNAQIFEQMNESDRDNPHRLMRKIELLKTHTVISHLSPTIILDNKVGEKIELEYTGITYQEKDLLVKAITRRVQQRIADGAIQEVEGLLKHYKPTDPGLNTIGYKQIIEFLKGSISREEAIQQWITKEVQYAKRQMTFMKKDKYIQWKTVATKS